MRNTIAKRIIIVAMIVCLIVVACALASCSIKKKALDSVSAESIKYDGQTIQWDSVKKADFYAVRVNDDSYQTAETKLDVVVTEDVTISILAKANDDNKWYRDAESAATVDFTAVGPVEVSFDGNEFVWTEAEGYTEYLCEQSGIETLLRVTGNSLAPARSADSANSDSSATLRVKPYVTEAHSFAVWSNTKSVTILRAPTNIAYNAYNASEMGIVLNNLITWDPVPGATKYRVELEGKDGVENIVTEVRASEFVFNPGVVTWDDYLYGNDSARKSFWVKITAIGDPEHDIMDSQTKERQFLHVPALDTSLFATNFGVLSWSNYEGGADKFDVYLRYTKDGVERNEVYSTYKPSFDGFEANINYHVRILPTSDDKSVYSSWSAESDFKFRAAPSISLEVPNKDDPSVASVIVNQVENNTNYKAYIYKNAPYGAITSETFGGERTINSLNGTMQLVWPTTEPGDYYVYVAAMDSNGVENTSRYSDPIHVIILEQITSVTFGTKDLDRPVFKDNKEVRGSTVEAAFNTPIYADGVDIYLDGTTPVTSTDKDSKIYYSVENGVAYRLHFTMELLDGDLVNGTYSSVQLRSTYKNAGKTELRDGYDTVVFNSALATGFALDQLAKVGNVSCTSDVISWNPADDATGYYYAILDDKDNKEVAKGFVYGTSVPVPGTLSAGTHKFYVAARGNGNIKVTGSFSTPFYLYKLPKPTDLQVNENSMTLSWNGDIAPKEVHNFTTEAAQYALTIGNATGRIDSNTYTLQDADIEAIRLSGALVTVRAIAAQTPDLKDAAAVSSDYSDSIILYKLAAPQTPVVTDNKFSWNKVENAASYSLCYGTDVNNRSVLCRVNVSQSDNTTPHLDIIADPEVNEVKNGEIALASIYNVSKGDSIRFYLVAHASTGTAEDRSPFVKKTENNIDRYYFESDASEAADIAVLSKPVVATDDATGEMVWPAVLSARNYCVIVNRLAKGATKPTSVDTYTIAASEEGNSFTPLIFGADGDTIKMELYALGDNGISSIRSESVFWDISLKQHTQPVASDFDVAFELGGSGKKTNVLVVTMKESAAESSEAQIYGINIGGIEKKYTLDALRAGAKISLTSGGDYNVYIRAIGGDMEKTATGYDAAKRYLDSKALVLETVSIIRDFTDYDVHLIRIDGALTLEVAQPPHATHAEYTLEYKNSNNEVLDTYTETKQTVAFSSGFAYITLSADAKAAGAVSVEVTLNGYCDPASDTIVDAQRPHGYSFGLK